MERCLSPGWRGLLEQHDAVCRLAAHQLERGRAARRHAQYRPAARRHDTPSGKRGVSLTSSATEANASLERFDEEKLRSWLTSSSSTPYPSFASSSSGCSRVPATESLQLLPFRKPRVFSKPRFLTCWRRMSSLLMVIVHASPSKQKRSVRSSS